MNSEYTLANEDFEAYINTSIGEGPYHCMSHTGLFKIEDILRDSSHTIVYSKYERNDTIEDLDRILKTEEQELNEKERMFRLAFGTETHGISTNLAFRAYKVGEKHALQVIETFLVKKETAHGVAIIVFSATSQSSYRAKIVTTDLQSLHLHMASLLEQYFIQDTTEEASREKPHLHIVKKMQNGSLYLSSVPLKMNRYMSPEIMELHYGASLYETQKKLCETLRKDQCGLHIFQGAPGMGKTTFISHLCAELAGKHKLVYVPNSSFEHLISPDNVDFWADACDDLQDDAKIILVVEDAEAILLKREGSGAAEASAVSSLLNLCDGLLGHMMGLHVIATANADFENFDEAILRAGRLKTRHIFQQLTYEQASKLAKHLDKELLGEKKELYTLAEVYNEPTEEVELPSKRTIGFLS